MGTARRQFVIAWTAVLAQVVTAALGPSFLLLCREADGSTHYERFTERCCADGSPIGHGSEPAFESADDSAQGCISCIDELVGPIAAVNEIRPAADPEVPGLFVTPSAVGIPLHGHCDGRGSARSLILSTDEGPPTQVHRALRATVLIL